jgi:predicted nucleotidyltransferase
MRKLNLDAVSLTLMEDANIVAAWTFGSAKDGRVADNADLDVGILCRLKPGLDELSNLRLQLQKALGFEDFDISVLNDASPILRFEALSGCRLFARDEDECAEFSSLTAREYEDEMAMSRRCLLRDS